MELNDYAPCVVRVLKGKPDANGNAETAGTGILVSPNQILTCAHVVASAVAAPTISAEEIERAEKPPEIDVWVEISALDAKIQRKNLPSRIASKEAWVPVQSQGAQLALEDLALLTLNDGVLVACPPLNWAAKRQFTVPVQFYGFGEETAGWVKGQYLGPNRDWHQIDCDRTKLWKGYSGAGVVDTQNQQLAGMLVAARAGKPEVYMVHAELLIAFAAPLLSGYNTARPRELSLITVLSRLLDRNTQVEKIIPYSKEHSLNCWVVECRGEDLPEFLAHKLKAWETLETRGLRVNLDEVNAVSVAMSPTKCFRPAVEEYVGPIEKWLQRNRSTNVIYVSESNGIDIASQVEAIKRELNRLHKEFGGGLGRLVVLVPFFADRYGWMKGRLARRRLAKLQDDFCLIGPPLERLNESHLGSFVEHLPGKSRHDFEARFDFESINEELIKSCLGTNKEAHYREIRGAFEGVLKNRLRPH